MILSPSKSQFNPPVFGPTKVTAFFGAFGRELPHTHLPTSLLGHSLHQLIYSDVRLLFTTQSYNNLSIDSASKNIILFNGRPFGLDESILNSTTKSDLCQRFALLDGKFSCLTYQKGRLILATDILGAGTLYYTLFQETLFFSTHLGLLLDILPFTPKINRLGTVSILLSGKQLFDETQFSNIFRLNAGSLIVASLNQHSQALDFEKIQYLSLLDLVNQPSPYAPTPEGLNELLSESLRRENYTSKATLMLSGGRDSRAIALNRPSQVNTAITFGTKDSYDLLGAKDLAKKLGMQHYFCPYEEWTLTTYEEQIVKLHSGCTGLQTNHGIVGYDWLQKAKVADVAIVGFLGDVLTGAHLGKDQAITEQQVLNTILGNTNNELIKKYFEEEIKFIIDEILKIWRNQKDISPIQHLIMLDLWYRQARFVSMGFDLAAWSIDISYPFFSRTLIQMLLNARDSDLISQVLYDKALTMQFNKLGLQRSLSDKVWSKLLKTYFFLIYRRKPVLKVYWPEIVKRTKINIEQYECGYREIDIITRESWNQALQSKSTAFTWPFFCTVAPLAAAFKRTEI